MKPAILITGTPGTGKTTLANSLEKRGYKIYNQLDLAQKFNCIIGDDRKRQAKIIDDHLLHERLADWLSKKTDFVIIEGHIADLIPAQYLNRCFVLSPSIEILRPRLIQRGYSKPKIDENIEAHIMKECYYDALEYYGADRTVDIEEDDLKQVVELILSQISESDLN